MVKPIRKTRSQTTSRKKKPFDNGCKNQQQPSKVNQELEQIFGEKKGSTQRANTKCKSVHVAKKHSKATKDLTQLFKASNFRGTSTPSTSMVQASPLPSNRVAEIQHNIRMENVHLAKWSESSMGLSKRLNSRAILSPITNTTNVPGNEKVECKTSSTLPLLEVDTVVNTEQSVDQVTKEKHIKSASTKKVSSTIKRGRIKKRNKCPQKFNKQPDKVVKKPSVSFGKTSPKVRFVHNWSARYRVSNLTNTQLINKVSSGKDPMYLLSENVILYKKYSTKI